MELFNDHFQSRDTALAAWTLTFGETTPYEWCVYMNGIPKKRFITKEDALHYLDEMIALLKSVTTSKGQEHDH